MRSLLVILFIALASYLPTDVRSPKLLPSVIYPLIFSLSLIALVMWLYLWAREQEFEGHHDAIGGDGDSDGAPGGDGDGN